MAIDDLTSAASEEDLMKTRLLIDGDGLGDDRRFQALIKSISKFASNEAHAEAKKDFEKIMLLLAQCKYVDSKNKMVQAMNQLEQSRYEALFAEIEEGISKAKEQIEQAKLDLIQARKIKRNKLEYDALAKVICENPERAVTGKKIEEVRSEIDQLREMEESLDSKLEMRKKQFHLLVHTIQELQELLNEEDNVGDSAGRDATPTRSNEDSMDIS